MFSSCRVCLCLNNRIPVLIMNHMCLFFPTCKDTYNCLSADSWRAASLAFVAIEGLLPVRGSSNCSVCRFFTNLRVIWLFLAPTYKQSYTRDSFVYTAPQAKRSAYSTTEYRSKYAPSQPPSQRRISSAVPYQKRTVQCYKNVSVGEYTCILYPCVWFL